MLLSLMRAYLSVVIYWFGDDMRSEKHATSAHSCTFNAMFDSAWRHFKPPFVLIWGLLFILTCGATPHQAVLGDLRGKEVNNNKLGAVASENKVCSQIGIDLLKAGGNAADAVSLSLRLVGAMLTRLEARRHSALCWRHRQGLLLSHWRDVV